MRLRRHTDDSPTRHVGRHSARGESEPADPATGYDAEADHWQDRAERHGREILSRQVHQTFALAVAAQFRRLARSCRESMTRREQGEKIAA